MTLSITPVYVAIFVLIQVAMVFPIGPYRGKVGIPFWGGEDKLDRMVRGHGNFIEFVPIFLLALATAEYLGANTALIWGCGAAMVLSRLVHYVTLQTSPTGMGRLLGTLLSLVVLVVLALTVLWKVYAS